MPSSLVAGHFSKGTDAGRGSRFVDFRDVRLACDDTLHAQNRFAVEAIDLQVRQGAFIAIVGPSGRGKSPFMKLATGLRSCPRKEKS